MCYKCEDTRNSIVLVPLKKHFKRTMMHPKWSVLYSSAMQDLKPDLTLTSVTCVPAQSTLLPMQSRACVSRQPCRQSRQTHSIVAIAAGAC